MGITYKTTNKSMAMPVYHRPSFTGSPPNCVPVNQLPVYQVVKVGSSSSGDYSMESRPKPSDLASAQTGRAYITRTNWTACVQEQVVPVKFACGTVLWYSWSYPEPYTYDAVYLTTLQWKVAPNPTTDMRNKIKAISYNMAETIGEYRETVDMVSGAGHKVFTTARRAYKRLPRKVRRKFSILDIPATYLLASFGLVPTLSTVHEALQAIAKQGTMPLRRRVIVTRKGETTVTATHPYMRGHATVRIQESRRMVLYVTYDASAITALTAGNPAEALWAATPFSWVVDYFLQVGSWLSSMDACRGVSVAYGSEVLKTTISVVDERYSTATGWSVKTPGHRVTFGYTRRPVSSVPSLAPTPEWRPSPSFRKLSYLLAIASGFKR